MIPSIVIRPGINELQELMIQAGKTMVGVAKGVGQWSGNKKTKVTFDDINDCKCVLSVAKMFEIYPTCIFVVSSIVLSPCSSSCARLVCFSAAGASGKTLETVKERLQRA